MNRRTWFIASSLVAVLASVLIAFLIFRTHSPTRVFLILVDTLRYDRLSCYGSATQTPNIDRLAARGQIFPNAVSSFHQTTMSMGALFTGRTPSIESGAPRKPLPWNGRTWCGLARFRRKDGESYCVPSSLLTLAEGMRQAGYRTIGITTNELLFRPAGFDRGFDEWTEVAAQPSGTSARALLDIARARAAPSVNRAVLDAVAGHEKEKLFVYIHYMDVHDWYVPGYSSYKAYPNYDRAVQAFDRRLGPLLDALESQGFFDDAVVILTADHGEALGEHHPIRAMHSHFGNPSFEPVLRVPLIIVPAVLKNARRVIRTEDVFRLILKLAGTGQDRARKLEPGELFVTERLFQTYREGRWKAVRRRGDGRLYLFDLGSDPAETQDVARLHPSIVAQYEKRIGTLTSSLAAAASPPAELSATDRERLRALGYLE